MCVLIRTGLLLHCCTVALSRKQKLWGSDMRKPLRSICLSEHMYDLCYIKRRICTSRARCIKAKVSNSTGLTGQKSGSTGLVHITQDSALVPAVCSTTTDPDPVSATGSMLPRARLMRCMGQQASVRGPDYETLYAQYLTPLN